MRSTIAAEACAADDGTDHGWFVAVSLTEILTGIPALDQPSRLVHRHATDCRSLYDAVLRENPSLEEKRVLVDVRSIQGTIHKNYFHWVPTDQMWADALTKVDINLTERFGEWLANPRVRLHE